MRRFVFALVTLLALAALASPAAAGVSSPYSDTDPTGDTSHPRGDIDRVRYRSVIGGTTQIDVGTVQATGPGSGVWNDRQGRTKIRVNLYQQGDAPDHQVRMRGTANGPRAMIFTLAGDGVPCDVAIQFLAARRIRLSFPTGCIELATSMKVNASYNFGPVGTAPADTDRWPDTGSTPYIFAECPPPPSGGEGC